MVGGMRPRAVVVTVTVAEPLVSVSGLTEQLVSRATIEQDRFTLEVNPVPGDTVTAFVKTAVVPAFTVSVVVPEAVKEKSGGGVTVNVNGAEFPAMAGSTIIRG